MAFLLWGCTGRQEQGGLAVQRMEAEGRVQSCRDQIKGTVGLACTPKRQGLYLGPGWKLSLRVCREKVWRGAWEGSPGFGFGEQPPLPGPEDVVGPHLPELWFVHRYVEPVSRLLPGGRSSWAGA